MLLQCCYGYVTMRMRQRHIVIGLDFENGENICAKSVLPPQIVMICGNTKHSDIFEISARYLCYFKKQTVLIWLWCSFVYRNFGENQQMKTNCMCHYRTNFTQMVFSYDRYLIYTLSTENGTKQIIKSVLSETTHNVLIKLITC